MYVHFQERVVYKYVYGEPVVYEIITDKLIPLESFLEYIGDDLIVEHYLNSLGEWDDNGEDDNGNPLETRVKYIVSETNMKDYQKRYKINKEV